MSLLAILDAIRASGEAQVREIEDRTEQQVQELISGALLEAEKIEAESCSASIAPAIRERSRILHHARLDALQITGNEREALVDAVLEQTRGHLEGLRTDVSYPTVLKLLTHEALQELGGSLDDLQYIQINIDPRDKTLMEGILASIGAELEVSTNLECWGGLIAKSQDGRVVVINTLEARLERASPHLRGHLASLFERENFDNSLIQVVDPVIAC